jgi:cytochrome b561
MVEGHSLTFLWGLEVAAPFAKSEGLGDILGDVHGLLGNTIMWVAGLHATAALYHHYLLRDDVLISMLPRWFP